MHRLFPGRKNSSMPCMLPQASGGRLANLCMVDARVSHTPFCLWCLTETSKDCLTNAVTGAVMWTSMSVKNWHLLMSEPLWTLTWRHYISRHKPCAARLHCRASWHGLLNDVPIGKTSVLLDSTWLRLLHDCISKITFVYSEICTTPQKTS